MLARVSQTVAALAITLGCSGVPVLAAETACGDNAAPGMRMYIDPQTGKPAVPPPSAQAVPSRVAPAGLIRQTAPGLIEEPVTAPPGGMKVDLRGRYRTAVTRRSDAPAATHECVPSSAAPQ